MNRNPVGWFEIYVQDLDRSKAFYAKTLEVAFEQLGNPNPGPGEPELWAFPMHTDAPGCAGALVKMAGKDSGSGGTIIYFSCADCAVLAARAVDAGGELQRAKFSIGPYGFVAYVKDPDGNTIGLHSME